MLGAEAVEVPEIEPRVMSMEDAGVVGTGERVVEVPDMVLPRASVVVRSHCFVSAVLGRMGGVLLALPPL